MRQKYNKASSNFQKGVTFRYIINTASLTALRNTVSACIKPSDPNTDHILQA